MPTVLADKCRDAICIEPFGDRISIPTNNDERPFFPFIKASIEKRSRAESDLEKAFWKEATNSCYGKTAQGLREKRTFNLKERKTERTQPSEITNPFYAAYITSQVRGVVGEIMNMIPADRMVFSVTTDGFITDATRDEIRTAESGPLSALFSSTRMQLVGNASVCEVKHEMSSLLGWKTRGQATLQPVAGKPFVLARAGIKPPISHEQDYEHNEYIVETFFNRDGDMKIEYQIPTSFREMVLYDADMVMKKQPRRTSMEYDFKRKPHAIGETDVKVKSLVTGKSKYHRHVAFSTAPWGSLSEFNAARKSRDDYWRKQHRCIKTVSDFRSWAEYFDSLQALGTKKSAYLRKQNGPINRLKRDLCRAFIHREAGLSPYRSLKAQLFANLLNEAGMGEMGVRVKRTDVENGARALFEAHTTPATSDVVRILNRLRTLLPGLDLETLLIRPAQEGVQLMPALERVDPFVARLP